MYSDVKVKIDLTKPAGRLGFGIPLLLETGAESAKPYTECNELEDVIEAGFDTTTNTYKTANLIFMQDDAPATIAVEATQDTAEVWLGKAENTSKSWRQIMFTENELNIDTEIVSIIPAIEKLDDKIAFFSVATDDELTGVTKTGVNRSFVFFCDPSATGGLPVGALVGATAGLTPGSFTYKNMILKGIDPQDITDLDSIHEKGGVTFLTKAGDNVTSEGKTLGGEYLDIIDTRDYIVQQIEYQTQKQLNTTPKISYDNNGIAMLESVAVNILKEAYNNGIIATGDDGKGMYSTSYGMREDTDDADRVGRRYVLGQFSFSLAGAIHEVEITGEIII